MTFIWIDNEDQLQQHCKALATQHLIAVDTEFVRTKTYYAIPGLIQIADTKQIYLIDPTVFNEHQLKPLGDVLLAPERRLLMHSAGEDLEIFLRLWGGLPTDLFDTQVAAGFAGFDRQVGLQRLLGNLFDIEISKEETRSDWLLRPLSEKQLHYAAEDVRYLFKLYECLYQKLVASGRVEWCQEECRALVDRYHNKVPDDQLYLGFGSGWKLQPKQQAALKHIASWREQTARALDIPKSFIAKDAVLFGLVQAHPAQKSDLYSIGLNGGQVRKFGDQLLEQLEIGLMQPPPDPKIPRPLTKNQQRLYKVLRSWLIERAEQLNMPSDLLASKAQLCDYLRARENGHLEQGSPFIGSWRFQELQPYFDQKQFPAELEEP